MVNSNHSVQITFQNREHLNSSLAHSFHLSPWWCCWGVGFSLEADTRFATNCFRTNSCVSCYTGVNSKNKTQVLVETLSDYLWTFGLRIFRGRQVLEFRVELACWFQPDAHYPALIFQCFLSAEVSLLCLILLMRNNEAQRDRNDLSKPAQQVQVGLEPEFRMSSTANLLHPSYRTQHFNSHKLLTLIISQATKETHPESKAKDLLPV